MEWKERKGKERKDASSQLTRDVFHGDSGQRVFGNAEKVSSSGNGGRDLEGGILDGSGGGGRKREGFSPRGKENVGKGEISGEKNRTYRPISRVSSFAIGSRSFSNST